ncbi:MAG TPA: hypothetical protein VMS56_06755 [Thermoanaerobaculia bacterium]|nr:hypothetical protein [Thermoanaerobaculia bacterium]
MAGPIENEREGGAPAPQTFSQLSLPLLDEVIRQFRATRNDILRYGVWNTRNLSDEEFNRIDDRKLFDYFRQDLLETRFLSKGRRVDLLQVWGWFDDQMSGAVPLLLGGREECLIRIEDKDLEKARRRIGDVASFMPMLRAGEFDAFRKVKYKLRRTVLRLTYELHHLSKRLEKSRRQIGPAHHLHSRLESAAVSASELVAMEGAAGVEDA